MERESWGELLQLFWKFLVQLKQLGQIFSKIKTHYSWQVANIALGLLEEEAVENRHLGMLSWFLGVFCFGELGPLPCGMSAWEASYPPWHEPQS